MEHSLHLASYHFVKSLRKASQLGNDDVLDEEPPLFLNEAELQSAEEEEDAGYLPGDILGKALGLITVVSQVTLQFKSILTLICKIRKSPQAHAFFLQQCRHEKLPTNALKRFSPTRWGLLYDVVVDLVDRQAVSNDTSND
jgi:hypothetical protein